mgnify:CR=1 FL=1
MTMMTTNERIAAPLPTPEKAAAARAPDLVSTALRHRWLIAVVGLLAMLLALAGGLAMTPKYKATAQLLVDPRDLKVLDNQLSPSAEAQNIDVSLVESQALVLGSETVLRRAAQRLDLLDDPEFNGSRRGLAGAIMESLRDIFPGLDIGAVEDRDANAALDRLKRAVQVYRINRSYVLAVGAVAASRDKARAIVDAIVASYLEEVASSRANLAKRAREDIDAGLVALRARVQNAEESLARYTQENNLVGVRGQIVSEQQLADLNSQLISARVEMARLKARLDGSPTSAADVERFPEAVASPTMRELRVQLSQVNLRKSRLAAQLRPGHPDMRDIADQERAVYTLIESELRRIRDSLSIQYQRAKETVTALESQLEQLRSRVNEANKAQIRLRELEREVEVNRGIYQQAVTRGLEAGQQARLNTANVQVIAAASVDKDRAFPPPLPLLAGFGFTIGALLAFLILHVRYLARAQRL